MHGQCCSTVQGLWSCRLGFEPGIGSRDSGPLLWILPSPLFHPRPRFCPRLAHLSSTHAAGIPQSLGHCYTPTLEEAAGQNRVGGQIKMIRRWYFAFFFCVTPTQTYGYPQQFKLRKHCKISLSQVKLCSDFFVFLCQSGL